MELEAEFVVVLWLVPAELNGQSPPALSGDGKLGELPWKLRPTSKPRLMGILRALDAWYV